MEANDVILPISSEQNSMDSLGQVFTKEIRPIIDVIDNLRRFGLQQDIDLPNVVVVGDQSSGKSSVIEAISGIELPRGKGIVTRCPLELQLKRVYNSPWTAKLTYKDIDGNQEKLIIKTPGMVENCIREAQNKMCFSNKGVSSNLITLRVESPAETAPDLTLIDLPGIARIAMEGQPNDICDQIRNIIMGHMNNKNTVILCVVSANLDAAVNESIKIAKQVDIGGTRTLGVITKPDTADDAHKDDVLALLNNEKIKLEKGFHMVKCRSQNELDNKLTLEESLFNENNFFNTDKYYRTAGKFQLGTFNLAKRITDELVAVIHTNLPSLRDKITLSLQESKKRLSSFANDIPEDKVGKLNYLFDIISSLNEEIKMNLIKGKCIQNDDNLFYDWRVYFNTFKTNIDKIKEKAISERFTHVQLKDKIARKRGNEISGFLNFEMFETIITDHVGLYKCEAESILNEMRINTENIINQAIHHLFQQIPQVESDLKQRAHIQLDLSYKSSAEKVNVIFEEERLVFTMDTAFEKEMEWLKNYKEKEAKIPKLSNGFGTCVLELKEMTMTENTKRLSDIIECYLKIVHCRLADIIPMTIRQCLHIDLSKNLKKTFIEYATNCDVENKVNENTTDKENRKNLQEKIERLQIARVELAKL